MTIFDGLEVKQSVKLYDLSSDSPATPYKTIEVDHAIASLAIDQSYGQFLITESGARDATGGHLRSILCEVWNTAAEEPHGVALPGLSLAGGARWFIAPRFAKVFVSPSGRWALLNSANEEPISVTSAQDSKWLL